MNTYTDKTSNGEQLYTSSAESVKATAKGTVFQFKDNRPQVEQQQKLHAHIQNHTPSHSEVAQLIGWESLGVFNPRRYLPELLGGYTQEQMQENGLVQPEPQQQPNAQVNVPNQQEAAPVDAQQNGNGVHAQPEVAQQPEAQPPEPPTQDDFSEWLGQNAVNVMQAVPNIHFYPKNGDTFRCYWDDSVHINGQTFGLGVNIHLNGSLGSTWMRHGPNLSINAQNNPARMAMQARMRALMQQFPNPADGASGSGSGRGRGGRSFRSGGRSFGSRSGKGADSKDWRKRK